MVKNLPANTGDAGLIPGLGRSSEEGKGNPLQYFALETPWTEQPGAGYSPWGLKELDMTEQLSTAQQHKGTGPAAKAGSVYPCFAQSHKL